MKIIIRTYNGEFEGELNPSPFADRLWLSLPISLDINMLGGMIYSECFADDSDLGEPTFDVNVGDIAYWPKAHALCLFFGSTPLSKEDGKPVPPYPVVKLGRLLGDYSELEGAGDRRRMTILR